MIKVGIVGCEGKLAREIIELIAEKKDYCVASAIAHSGSDRVGERLYTSDEEVIGNPIIMDDVRTAIDCDVLVDATNRKAFIEENYYKYMQLNKPLIIATTGFEDEDMEKIDELAKNMVVVKAPNYSFELYYFMEALKVYVRNKRDIDVSIIELHHKQKLDKPSGTALSIKETLLQENSALHIDIHSIRAGKISGEHKVVFSNMSGEEICFSHKVTSRRVFADGIVKIISMLGEKVNGKYSLEDFVDN